MKGRPHLSAHGLLALVSLTAAPLLAVPPLVQLPGTAGCVSETGTGGACADGNILDGAFGVEVSPDGRTAYVVASESDALVAFDRNPTTGALTPKVGAALCVSETGSGGVCADGVALDTPDAMAISPDGRHAYVSSVGSNAVVVLDRNVTTGQLTQKAGTAGCINETGNDGCAVGRAFTQSFDVAVSPDGRNVYLAAASDDALLVFDRDVSTGVLTQKAGAAGCVDDVAADGCADGVALDGPTSVVVSPDGRHVYSVSNFSDAVTAFDRDIATGALVQKGGTGACISETGTGGLCADGVALDGVMAVAMSGDGTSVYVVGGDGEIDAVAVFDRNVSTGVLTQKAGLEACVSETGANGLCADGAGMNFLRAAAVSGDGRSVYVAGFTSDAVAVFDRNPATGVLTQKAGLASCTSDTGTGGTCADGVALDGPAGVTVSPDGRSVYVASGNSNAVVVFTREVPVYDIDGDGEVTALTDGLLLLRHSFGFTGAILTAGAVDLANCTRCTAELIAAYIQAMLAP